MINGLKPYPKMKDSGVEWLGAVPEHWEVRRFKYILGESDVRSVDGVEQLLRVSQYTGVTERKRVDGGDEPDTRAESLVGYKVVAPGELVVNIMLAWNGSLGISPFSGIASPAYCVYRFREQAEPWYFHHLLRSPTYKARIKAVSTGVVESRLRLYTDDLFRLEAVVPPPLEQAAIVRFLEYADRRIRRYIRAKQKLIKLLEEQKQAIIHQAVTRGLDPNVRLKPSGVEWLGDVPEHWEVVPLCSISRPRKTINQAHRELLSVYLGKGVIPFSAVEAKRTNPTGEDLSRYQVVEPGDFVLNNQQAWRGSVGVSRYSGIVSPAYLILELNNSLDRDFADRLLADRAMVAQYVVSSKGVGSIQRNLYWPHLRRVVTLIPPLLEQAAIVRFLDEETASLTKTIAEIGREIALLREYRTRLIADVVTGKLDVREAAANLPDELEEPDLPDETALEVDDEAVGDEALVEDSA